METPADFTIAETDGRRMVVCTGDWSALCLTGAEDRLRDQLREGGKKDVSFDLRKAGRVDSAGALLLVDAYGGPLAEGQVVARPETLRLVMRISEATTRETPDTPKVFSFNNLMARLGKGLIGVLNEFYDTVGFNGRLLVTVGKAIARPHKVRWASVINLTEQAGIDAMPIVAITNFFIGAVLAFLAAGMLSDFGLQSFSVQTVGFGVLREFAVVITAVLLAGRSASSFAAELGAMKMQQEIDAMEVMGVDPFEALVLPRFLAMLFIMPLTLLGVLTGLFGGCVTLWATLGISPSYFIAQIPETVGWQQFAIGMSKAPVMAVVIAAIGCRQGMLVGGDVESLGRRVTTAVVQAIFSIIIIDAIFALIYLEMDI